MKAAFRGCWQHSDGPASLQMALQERGYFLARGDRGAVVAVDWRGEVYARSRWAGAKAKDVKAKLTDADQLPSIAERRAKIPARMSVGGV